MHAQPIVVTLVVQCAALPALLWGPEPRPGNLESQASRGVPQQRLFLGCTGDGLDRGLITYMGVRQGPFQRKASKKHDAPEKHDARARAHHVVC